MPGSFGSEDSKNRDVVLLLGHMNDEVDHALEEFTDPIVLGFAIGNFDGTLIGVTKTRGVSNTTVTTSAAVITSAWVVVALVVVVVLANSQVLSNTGGGF